MSLPAWRHQSDPDRCLFEDRAKLSLQPLAAHNHAPSRSRPPEAAAAVPGSSQETIAASSVTEANRPVTDAQARHLGQRLRTVQFRAISIHGGAMDRRGCDEYPGPRENPFRSVGAISPPKMRAAMRVGLGRNPMQSNRAFRRISELAKIKNIARPSARASVTRPCDVAEGQVGELLIEHRRPPRHPARACPRQPYPNPRVRTTGATKPTSIAYLPRHRGENRQRRSCRSPSA